MSPPASVLLGTAEAAASPPRQWAKQLIKAWERGEETPDAAAALADHPEWEDNKSLVLELAYEEFCLRDEAGEALDPEEFCDRFPAHRSSLRTLLGLHQLAHERAHLLEAEPRWPEPGDRVGDFRLLRVLGHGAFARVFLAVEESTGDRPVVVKFAAADGAEARTLGRLAHPNIVEILSAPRFADVGLTAVCMPFLGSATLQDVLARAFPIPEAPPPRRAAVILQALRETVRPGDPAVKSRLPATVLRHGSYVEGVLSLGAQLADALAFVHSQGVCHRDLKPANVLLSPDGRPMLFDFNLSADARTAPAHLGGTLPYMAPEQIRALRHPAEAAELDERADLFSLGVILYELLAGQHPFGPLPRDLRGRELETYLLGRQQAGYQPLRPLNPEVGPALARLVERCLELDRTQRPTAAELAAALKRYLSRPAQARRWMSQHATALFCLSSVLLLTVGAAVWSLATRAPLSVRAHRQGQLAYAQHDYMLAEQHLTQALDADPNQAAVLFARGRARLKRSDGEEDSKARTLLTEALNDFTRANEIQEDAASLACMGYCMSLLQQNDAAIFFYNRALALGFCPAKLLNNRAFAIFQSSNLTDPVKFKDARRDLDEALRHDPALQAAYRNRAFLAYKQWRKDSMRTPLPESAVSDAHQAATLGPCDNEFYVVAACITAAMAEHASLKDWDHWKEQTLDYLRLAVSHGHDPQRLLKFGILTELISTSEFDSLSSTQVPLKPGSSHLIDPITE
jgi:serine/threonine protein kinase